jgi:hypothetical protein
VLGHSKGCLLLLAVKQRAVSTVGMLHPSFPLDGRLIGAA